MFRCPLVHSALLCGVFSPAEGGRGGLTWLQLGRWGLRDLVQVLGGLAVVGGSTGVQR